MRGFLRRPRSSTVVDHPSSGSPREEQKHGRTMAESATLPRNESRVKDEIKRIQNYVWARHVDGSDQYDHSIDEDQAIRVLDEFYSEVGNRNSEDQVYLGILLFEKAFDEEEEEARLDLFRRARKIFLFYRKVTGEDDWDAIMNTNLKGVFLMAQAAARAMTGAGKGGSIINIASILGLRVTKGLTSYIASKAGVVHLTRALALEFSRYGIRVNALAPGYFVTEINQAEFEQGAAERVRKQVPMARVGEMPEIDGPLLLLASDAGSYMTGSILAVDGGHLCNSL